MSHSRLSHLINASQSEADSFGLVAWLEQTRIRLPLRGVEVHFHVTGTLARVEITQVFQNTREVPLDVSYLFPLPAAASVHRCELIAEGRVVAAVVEEEQAAREQYARAKAEGHRVALVEARRDNLFSLALGNIQPGEVLAVRFGYVQELERAIRTVALRIPVCPGERYIPGKPLLRSNRGTGTIDDTDEVPDASLVSPPRIDALHPDAALFHLSGEIQAGALDPAQVTSPSHLVALRRTDTGLRVGFVGDGNVPDRDFILRWEMPELAPDSALLLAGAPTEGRRRGLLRLMPPAAPDMQPQAPRRIWFLVDRSGSMAGTKWTRTCEALIACVRGLDPADRVSITFFDTQAQPFADTPLAPVALLGDARFLDIASIGVGGGTEILPALTKVVDSVAQHRTAGAVDHLVVITDGEVGNESAVLEALSRTRDLTVHTIGIDTAVNDGLLQKMAVEHGGRCMLLSPQESVLEAVELVLRGSAAPVLRDVRWAPGVSSPDRLPAQFAAGLEYSYAIDAAWSDGDPILTATRRDGSPWACQPSPVPGDAETLRLIGARREIDRLQALGDQAAAIALARTHNLVCRGASFIAIDRASKVPVAQEESVQPTIASYLAEECRSAPRGIVFCRRIAQIDDSTDTQDKLRDILNLLRGRTRTAAPDPARDDAFLRIARAATTNLGGNPRDVAPIRHAFDAWWDALEQAIEALREIFTLIATQRLPISREAVVEAMLARARSPLPGIEPTTTRAPWKAIALEGRRRGALVKSLHADHGARAEVDALLVDRLHARLGVRPASRPAPSSVPSSAAAD